MNGDAEAARELDRLRTELLEFVVDALGERMANGDYADLSERLVEAIDRRVDQAVAARLADTDWPDPDRFVDDVLTAAAGRAGDGEPVRSARRTGTTPSRRRLTPLHIGLLMLGAVILTAAATYFVLQIWDGTTTTNVTSPVSDPIIIDTNGVQIDAGNGAAGNIAAPPPGNPAQNAQRPTP